MLTSDKIVILEAERMNGGLLIHFSDGLVVLFHTQFLNDVRNEDGNQLVPSEPEEYLESEEMAGAPE
jgi:hypothetical protein